MAIPAVNLSYTGNGPTATGQVIASTETGGIAQDFEGFGTATLDGTISNAGFLVNFIDGTATLSFTPSAVLVQVCGGTQPVASFVSAVADLITNTGFTCRLSAAGTNGNTLKIAVRVIK